MAKMNKIEKDIDRLNALHKLKLQGDQLNPELEKIVQEAADICKSPISLINLVDRDNTFFMAKVGTTLTGSPREISFCSHAIEGSSIMEAADAMTDERFNKNPLVTGDPNIKFYAGAPLITKHGYNIGTLCVFDTKAKKLDDTQLEALDMLSRKVIIILESNL